MPFTKCRVLFSTAFAIFACLVFWLVSGEGSPLREYFLYHVEFPNLVGRLFLLPYLALVIVRPEPGFNENALGYGLAFLQSFAFGYFLSLLIRWRKSLP
jgi:hypothetical protein